MKAFNFISTFVFFFLALLALVSADPSPSTIQLYKRQGNVISNWLIKKRIERGRKQTLDKLEGRTRQGDIKQKTVEKWIKSLPNRQNALTLAMAHTDAKKVWEQKRQDRANRQG
ncbi:hypothetical protein GQ42DRAFT_157914 [Ramicandelaber brevisporus]|nr:hypothetical protein GQ42DRAFT_157914 [Ramicandelaber brevisporus]